MFRNAGSNKNGKNSSKLSNQPSRLFKSLNFHLVWQVLLCLDWFMFFVFGCKPLRKIVIKKYIFLIIFFKARHHHLKAFLGGTFFLKKTKINRAGETKKKKRFCWLTVYFFIFMSEESLPQSFVLICMNQFLWLVFKHNEGGWS